VRAGGRAGAAAPGVRVGACLLSARALPPAGAKQFALESGFTEVPTESLLCGRELER